MKMPNYFGIDIAEQYSSEGVYRTRKIPFSPEEFLSMYDVGYDVDQFRLLLECGSELNDLLEKDTHLKEILDRVYYYNLNTMKLQYDNEDVNSVLADKIEKIIKTDPDVIRLIDSHDDIGSLVVSINHISYEYGLILFTVYFQIGTEEWDYATPEREYCGLKSGRYEYIGKDYIKKNIDHFYGYVDVYNGYAEVGSFEFDEDKFFEDCDENTYFLVLNAHI